MDLKLVFSFVFVVVSSSCDEELVWSSTQDNLTRDGKDWANIQPRNIEPTDFNIPSQIDALERIVGGDLVDFNSVDLEHQTVDWDNLLTRSSQEKHQRVYGGKVAEPHSVPYQGALIITTPQGQFFCGASLISLKYVLTAAHCLEGATEVEIILGAHNIQEIEPTQQRYLSTIFKIHEHYNTVTLANDIGIVELPINATINDYVKKIRIPTSLGSMFSNWFGTAVVSGWGKVTSSSDLSPELKIGDLTIIPNILCMLVFPATSFTGNVCTFGYLQTSGCNGDSGGPLIFNNVQVGIVSFGARWCELGFPTVFTRVAAHVKWIQSNTDVALYPY